MGRRYKRGGEFPHEQFVQDAFDRHFEAAGYMLDLSTHVDLLGTHPVTGDAWHIEAKGKTSAIGLDFRTCLGQLLQRISLPHIKHGIALPDMPQYRTQTAQLSDWVVGRVGVFWLFVSTTGAVEIVPPVVEKIFARGLRP
jgi:hypothetical protein